MTELQRLQALEAKIRNTQKQQAAATSAATSSPVATWVPVSPPFVVYGPAVGALAWTPVDLSAIVPDNATWLYFYTRIDTPAGLVDHVEADYRIASGGDEQVLHYIGGGVIDTRGSSSSTFVPAQGGDFELQIQDASGSTVTIKLLAYFG